ncbi:MAG: peptide-N-glycosidase F-related protein, partial [Bacteroidota bacterium]
MKKLYTFLCLALIASPALFAGTGDTTHVATHQQTHWTWWGGTDTTVLFPDDSKRYEKILMYYTLGCPASGCSEWDYTTKIEVRHDNGVDSLPQLIELARIITPYAGTYSNDWKHTWTFDVTDYAPILRDSVTIRAFYGGWQNGFTVTIDFDFIEGIPPRDPLMVSNLYRSGPGGWKYGIAADPIESKLIPKDVAIPADAANTAVRFTASGHGFGNNNGGNPLNCAEFCEKDFMVKVDGVQRYSQAMWRDDCGMVALYPQGGTWLFNRANWCPGEKAIAYTHELTDFVTPGSTASLDIDL